MADNDWLLLLIVHHLFFDWGRRFLLLAAGGLFDFFEDLVLDLLSLGGLIEWWAHLLWLNWRLLLLMLH